jgi:hypothetical protein
MHYRAVSTIVISCYIVELCCATAVPSLGVAPEVGLHGLVEALLGSAAVTYLLLRRRSDKFSAVLRRCTAEIERSSDEWLDNDFRGDPNATNRRDAAVAAIREVLPLIIPKAEELVEARLTEPRVAAYYLDRAAKAQPFDFAEKLSNDDQEMARGT